MRAGTCFPKVRRMLLFLAPLTLIHFWPASTLLHGHIALAILSPPQTDPQILERWGCADEVHLGKSFRAKDFGLECQRDETRLLWIEHIGLVSVCLSSSAISMKTSAAPCPGIRNPNVVYVMSDPHSFGPFTRLFINLTMCRRALFSKSATTLGLVEQAFWRMPLFTEWIGASSFEVILAGPSKHSTTGTLSSGTSGSRRIFLILPRERGRRRIRLCRFCTLIDIVTETAIVPLEHRPLAFHCQQSPRVLCSRCLSPDYWPQRSSQNFHFWRQNCCFVCLARYFSSP